MLGTTSAIVLFISCRTAALGRLPSRVTLPSPSSTVVSGPSPATRRSDLRKAAAGALLLPERQVLLSYVWPADGTSVVAGAMAYFTDTLAVAVSETHAAWSTDRRPCIVHVAGGAVEALLIWHVHAHVAAGAMAYFTDTLAAAGEWLWPHVTSVLLVWAVLVQCWSSEHMHAHARLQLLH